MTPDIPSQVAENRQDVKRIDGQLITVPENVDQNLRFLRNTITVDVSIAVYTRSLNESLISGHPDGSSHGSGQGKAGDIRGAWQQQVSGGSTHEWTRDGRNAVRDALDGQTGAADHTVVGTDGTDATPTDSTLVAQTGSSHAYGIKDSGNETRIRSQYLFSEHGVSGTDLQEFGIEDTSGRLLARATSSSAVSIAASQEVRVDLSATITGSGGGDAVITSDGETAIADSIKSPATTVGLQEIAWGTGSQSIGKSTTSLANEVFRKDVARSLELESIEVSAPQFEFEPSGQPYDYTEAAVFDNTGRLVWVVGFDTREKDSQTQFSTSVAFRIV